MINKILCKIGCFFVVLTLVSLILIGGASAATQAYVDVNCNANGAHIVIIGENNTVLSEGDVSGGVASFKIDLPAKITAIKATKTGYEDKTITINETLGAGDLKTYNVDLTEKQSIVGGNAGIIQIKVYSKNTNTLKETPYVDAKVQLYDVGDNLVGETTTSGAGIAEFKLNTTATPVKYAKVIPTLLGSEVKTIQIETPNAGQTIPYNVEYIDTTVSTGTLSIDSSPTGATIYIDGTYYGATPTTVSLDSGLHTIKLEKDGYSSITKTATITDGETTRLYPVLSKIYTSGTLAVSSIPSDATVYVDDELKGTTPLTINLENGSHSVCVDKLGYEPYNTTVTISGGNTTVISPGLSELPSTSGKLIITSTPSRATVYIDGKTNGITPLGNISLSTGSHQITLKLDGYDDWSKQVYITENNLTSVTATLDKKSDSSGITLLSPPFLIAIIAILVCGIVAVVIVTSRSSRRKRSSINTTKPSEKAETPVNPVHTSETKQVTNTTIKNETKTEVKGGDTIINIHAENYVAGNVGTIAKDNAVVNRSGVDVFEQVRKCPYCGSDISADSDFCSKCGRRLK